MQGKTSNPSCKHEVSRQSQLVASGQPRVPLDVLVLGLLLWLPIETWILRFLPQSNVLLVLPDLVSLGLGATIVFLLFKSKALGEYVRRNRWLIASVTLLAVVASISALANRVAPLEFAYWARVYLRFIPLAMVAACPPWTERIIKRMPYVIALSLGLQLEIAFFEIVMGRRAASMFWPGSFQLGSVQTAVSTLSGVEGRFIAGTFGHYNILAWYIVLASALIISRLLSKAALPKPVKIIFLAELLLAGFVLVMSQSRQAFFVVVLVAIPFVLYLEHEYRLRHWCRTAFSHLNTLTRHLIPMLALVLVVVVGVLTLPRITLLADRYAAVFTPAYWQVAGDNRGYAIGTTVPRVARHNPILGVGPGSFGREWTVTASSAPPAVKKLDLDLHHFRYLTDVGWASVFAQIGALGTLSLLALFVAVAVIVWRNRRRPSFVVLASAGLVLLGPGMIAGAPLTYKATSSLFWVIMGLTFGAAELTSEVDDKIAE